jgi:UDP-N-acetylmuramoyl-L-alanyl-D-glutamate--2,6-diaminopimelate ligase
VTDADGAAIAADAGLPILVVDDPRGMLGDLSAWVYGTGADDDLPLLFGTTGTNGKTSVSHILEGILGQLGVVTGLSSTAERHIAGEVIVSRLTTPEASEFHALLALMRERGVEAVAVEVSAQALSRHRVDGLVFDVAGFTNLSHDHLDDYADMTEYFEAKLPLFRPDRSRRAVISLDSTPGLEVVERCEVPLVTVGTPAIAADPDAAASADWTVEILDERPAGTRFRLESADGRTLTTVVPVIGPHMAANAGLAIVMLLEGGYSWEVLVAALDGGSIEAYLPGRTQLVSGERGPAVYVDFGHSPDAFEKTLAAVRRVTPGKVLMLVGADGDRDATKRHDMGRTAVCGSDILVITDHHPRFENPESIRATLIEGARRARPDAEIHDYSPPERAIIESVALVGDGDAILWAGPGHQDYRDIRGVRTPYSARELARRALADAGWPVPEPHWPVPYPADSTPLSDPERDWR